MRSVTAVATRRRLAAKAIRVHFEGVKAVDDVDVAMTPGEILGLIGPNGAGKTTLINALSGFQRLTGGSLTLDDADATKWSPQKLCESGIVRTFQNVRLFDDLTVLENVTLGALVSTPRRRQAEDLAWQLLDRFHLADHAATKAGALPYGDERKIGIARALGAKPDFLLADEPAAGMSEAETAELVDILRTIRDDFGCGLLVVEHDMHLIMELCDRIQVLDHGVTIAVGTPSEIRNDPAVLKAYLG